MFKIINGRMSVIQGDTGIFNVSVDNYTFVQGDIAYFTVRKDLTNTEYALQKIVSTFEGNTFKVFLDKTDTNIEAGDYVYDIQLSLADGRVDTVIQPTKFTVLGGVTLD